MMDPDTPYHLQTRPPVCHYPLYTKRTDGPRSGYAFALIGRRQNNVLYRGNPA